MNTSQTLYGNLTRDIELDTAQNGDPRARFSIAMDNGKERDSDKKKDATFVNVTMYGREAENFANSARKGQRVSVFGRFESFSTPAVINGEEKNIGRLAFKAFEGAISTKWGTAKFESTFEGGNRGGNDSEQASKPAESKPRTAAKAKPAAATDDEW